MQQTYVHFSQSRSARAWCRVQQRPLWPAKAASQAYNEQVQSAGKDHDQGPPHVHVWAALLQNAVDSAITPPQKEAIEAHMTGATTPQSLVHDVLYCRVATTYDKKHMKVYVATQPAVQEVVDELFAGLSLQGGIEKYGLTPKGAMERELQNLLEEIQSKS